MTPARPCTFECSNIANTYITKNRESRRPEKPQNITTPMVHCHKYQRCPSRLVQVKSSHRRGAVGPEFSSEKHFPPASATLARETLRGFCFSPFLRHCEYNEAIARPWSIPRRRLRHEVYPEQSRRARNVGCTPQGLTRS